MLCSCRAINSHVDVHAGAKRKLLFARQEERNESFIISALQMVFLLQLLHDLKRRRGDAGELHVTEKSTKKKKKTEAEKSHRAVNVPEPAREEIFYKGLVLFLLALSRTSNLPVRLLFTSGCCRRGIVQRRNTEL